MICYVLVFNSCYPFQCVTLHCFFFVHLQTVCPATGWPSPHVLVQLVPPAQLLLTYRLSGRSCRPVDRSYRPAISSNRLVACSYRPACIFPLTASGGSVQISWLPGGAERQGQAVSGPIHLPNKHCLRKKIFHYLTLPIYFVCLVLGIGIIYGYSVR
jgi:hypothetical protein